MTNRIIGMGMWTLELINDISIYYFWNYCFVIFSFKLFVLSHFSILKED